MTDAEDRLRALFAEDAPPARDPAFSTAVMERIARRRFLGEVALLSSFTLAGGSVLWAVGPSLAPTLAELSLGVTPLVGCLMLALTALAMLDRRIVKALGLES
ncbi:MAG: hypothetical protein GC203_22675 [Phenylobacterium sp.]|uniref:hypothetical protein n=1 Tax=Phenylobacterium sp. TaxID=1871053 RepID=UPI0025D1B5AD|nr:hypothetical protein [Phenylobacterium sp.]MBI1200678.1 hypothetical protein [Phenylobacterium sp.]